MQTVYDNASKIQMRMMAWMREPEWKWHIVHTDHMADVMPTQGVMPQHPPCVLSLGAGKDNASQMPQGPPN